METRQHKDGSTAILSFRIGRMLRAAWGAFDPALNGEPSPQLEPELVDKGTGDERGDW